MNRSSNIAWIIVSLVALLTGCAGYDRILFLSKTNVGIDVSREPLPTAEITIARREVGILPTYQDTKDTDTTNEERTVPLFGAFSLTGGFFNPTIGSVFAGGCAAVEIAKASDPKFASGSDKNDASSAGDSNNSCSSSKNEDTISLSAYPDTRSPLGRLWDKLTGNKESQVETKQVKPFYFATDASYGAKVAWDGTGGPYPTSLKIGYNRAEFAYPPVFVSIIHSSAEETSKSANETSKSANETSKLAGETSKLAGETSKLAGETSKLAGETSKLAGETSKLANETSKSANETNKSANETSKLAGETSKLANETKKYHVRVPSFFASIKNISQFGLPLINSDTGVSQTQVFATGKAATKWAEGLSVKQATHNMIFPLSNPTKSQSAATADTSNKGNDANQAKK